MSEHTDDLPPERAELEEKSSYTKKHHQRGVLVKTLVSMANTSGGRIVLKKLDGVKLADFDSAKLDDLLRKYVAPPVDGLCSWSEDGTVYIDVPESTRKPHVFTCDLWYEDDKGRRKPAFSPGQVWVRHSSKNEPAKPEDFSRFMREEVSRFLQRMSVQVGNADYPLQMTEGEGLPVRLSNDAGAVPVVPDIPKAYPYTTKALGELFGKGQNWAARASSVLGFKDNPEYWWGWRHPTAGWHAVQLYSEAAAEVIRQKLKEDPAWSPYKKQEGKKP